MTTILVLTYIAAALASVLPLSRVIWHSMRADTSLSRDASDRAFACAAGFCLASVWPAAIVVAMVYRVLADEDAAAQQAKSRREG